MTLPSASKATPNIPKHDGASEREKNRMRERERAISRER